MPELIRQRNALYGCFFVLGLVMASWIVRTPSVRDALGASTAEMGFVLFGLSVGSMTGILRAGSLVRRFGTRRVIIAGLTLGVGGLFLIAAGAALSLAWVVAPGLACVGLGMATSEVGVNVEGAVVERGLSRPVLPLVHGCYSLGTVIGALLGMSMSALKVPVSLHLSITAIALAPLALLTIRNLTQSADASGDDENHGQGFFATMTGDHKLLLIGLIVLGMALAEGSASDWLPLLMVDAHGMPEGSASLIFVGFAMTMTIGRFLGPVLLDRLGAVNVIRLSAVAAMTGVATVVFSDSSVLAGLAVLLWGLGASLGFPVVMSAAGSTGQNASARVSAVATIGYMAFLVGPPLLGYVGEHFGLRLTMVIVLTLLVPCILLSSALETEAERRLEVKSGEI